ncbi:hypothetical protein Bca52824_043768 [Brassica carinata]|uniref:Uncharacterized protein n=1 Tax=Brassica carinata TaxID=52824 RepID=A0A8X7S3Z9_BRACI|nr:hypothetical protein Bca52824_043768 [Brassica carinata]
MNLRLPLQTPPRIIMYVCLGPESRAPTSSSSSSQAWLVVVVQFVFQPAAPDLSSATPVIISVMAELQIEKLDISSNGYLVHSPTPSCSRPSPSSESAVVTAGIVGIEVKKNDNGDL